MAFLRRKAAYGRDEHYPYLVTGVADGTAPRPKMSLRDFVRDVLRSRGCRHAAYVEHSPGLNCKFEFKLFNTWSAKYEPEGQDVVDGNGLQFVAYHITNGGGSDLTMTGGSRLVDISSSQPGVCQFASRVTALDIFTGTKMYERGPIACDVNVR